MKYLSFLLFLLFINSSLASVETDAAAPDFELINSYGDNISLSNFEGSTVVLEWTNHDCPFVAKHYKTGNMQSTQKIAKDQVFFSKYYNCRMRFWWRCARYHS